MTVDTLTISLPAPLAEEVRAAAAARGLSPEDYVRQQLAFDIAQAETDWGDIDTAEDEAAVAEYEKTGIATPWEDIRAWMRSWGTENELPKPAPRKLR